MTEHDYIVATTLTKLRAAQAILRGISPIDGVHEARCIRWLHEAKQTMSMMAAALEVEVDRLTDEDDYEEGGEE